MAPKIYSTLAGEYGGVFNLTRALLPELDFNQEVISKNGVLLYGLAQNAFPCENRAGYCATVSRGPRRVSKPHEIAITRQMHSEGVAYVFAASVLKMDRSKEIRN